MRSALIQGNVALLPLGGGRGYAKIDVEHVHVQQYAWSLNSDGCVQAKVGGKAIKLHLLIFGAPPYGLVTDHINQDKLDNRACNLRCVNKSINGFNRKANKNNTSGHKGVNYAKHTGKWRAAIGRDGVTVCLGYYEDINEAIAVRRAAEATILI